MPRTYKTSGYKHRQYEDIARILGVNWTDDLRGVYSAFVALFEQDNDRFDRDRFDNAIRSYIGVDLD